LLVFDFISKEISRLLILRHLILDFTFFYLPKSFFAFKYNISYLPLWNTLILLGPCDEGELFSFIFLLIILIDLNIFNNSLSINISSYGKLFLQIGHCQLLVLITKLNRLFKSIVLWCKHFIPFAGYSILFLLNIQYNETV
jgi:hypothetical protein